MKKILFSLAITAACALLLSACSPKYDWREVRGTDVPFSIVLPAKPATSSRPVTLDHMQVTMTMTATDVDGVVFAVGAAELPDAAAAAAALDAMKTALVRNIGGTVRREAASSVSSAAGSLAVIDVEAIGAAQGDAPPRLLVARFIASGRRVYQLVVTGKEQAVSREAVDTFLTSFKPA